MQQVLREALQPKELLCHKIAKLIQTFKLILTGEIRKRLTDKIQHTQDGRILEEVYRLLEMESEDINIYKLHEAQKKAISLARDRIKQGQFLSEEDADKEISNS